MYTEINVPFLNTCLLAGIEMVILATISALVVIYGIFYAL